LINKQQTTERQADGQTENIMPFLPAVVATWGCLTSASSSVLGLNYEAHGVPDYKFNTFATQYQFGNNDLLSETNTLTNAGHLAVRFAVFTRNAQKLLFVNFHSKFWLCY